MSVYKEKGIITLFLVYFCRKIDIMYKEKKMGGVKNGKRYTESQYHGKTS